MGITFFFDPRPAWERDFHSCRHLPSEKAIFFIFSTPPQRESKKSMKSHLEAPSWTTRRERCEKQIGTKTSPSSLDYERDVFLKSTKLHRIETELCVFLKDYNELWLRRIFAHFKNLNTFHENYSKTLRKLRKIAPRSCARIASTSWSVNWSAQASNFHSTTTVTTEQNCKLCMNTADRDPECGVLM